MTTEVEQAQNLDHSKEKTFSLIINIDLNAIVWMAVIVTAALFTSRLIEYFRDKSTLSSVHFIEQESNNQSEIEPVDFKKQVIIGSQMPTVGNLLDSLRTQCGLGFNFSHLDIQVDSVLQMPNSTVPAGYILNRIMKQNKAGCTIEKNSITFWSVKRSKADQKTADSIAASFIR